MRGVVARIEAETLAARHLAQHPEEPPAARADLHGPSAVRQVAGDEALGERPLEAAEDLAVVERVVVGDLVVGEGVVEGGVSKQAALGAVLEPERAARTGACRLGGVPEGPDVDREHPEVDDGACRLTGAHGALRAVCGARHRRHDRPPVCQSEGQPRNLNNRGQRIGRPGRPLGWPSEGRRADRDPRCGGLRGRADLRAGRRVGAPIRRSPGRRSGRSTVPRRGPDERRGGARPHPPIPDDDARATRASPRTARAPSADAKPRPRAPAGGGGVGELFPPSGPPHLWPRPGPWQRL